VVSGISAWQKFCSRLPWLRWWAEHEPWWHRHIVYWAIAVVFFCLSFFNMITHEYHPWKIAGVLPGVVLFVYVGAILVGIALVSRESARLTVPRTLSRSGVFTALVLTALAGFLAIATHGWPVDIQACHMAPKGQICGGNASPQDVLGMLAWHAANVVPALDITGLGWSRPARSTQFLVGASIVAVRLCVAIGLLAVAKRLWDKFVGVEKAEGNSEAAGAPAGPAAAAVGPNTDRAAAAAGQNTDGAPAAAGQPG
jgi:hypothetical protein